MSDASRQAVEATYGQYIWYNGGLTEPVYFSCDGGATEDAGNIWYEDTPYLKGKTDPYEAAVSDKIERYSWSVTYTRQELTDLLNGKGYANSGIVDVQVTKTSPTGNVLAITFTDSAGKSFTKTKEDCRTFLGLRSQRYSISGGSGGYAVNGEGTLPSVSGVYAVDGSGTVSQLPSGQPYVIGGDAAVLATPETDSAPAAIVEAPVAESETIAPTIHAEPQPQQKPAASRLPLIIAAILLLVVIASALWWFMVRDKGQEVVPAVQAQQAPAAAAPEATNTEPKAPAGCSAQSLDTLSELEFVQTCVQEKLDSDKLLAIIQSAKEAKKCGVAQRLYANRAQGGDTKIALIYAGEYDPKYHQASECFKEADKDTAAYWYETVLQSEPENQTAKQRLEELAK